MEENFLTERQVCEMLQVSPSTLLKLRREYDLPCYKFAGSVRYNPITLEGWIKLQQLTVDGLDVDQLELQVGRKAKEEKTNE